jgi:hypothetical protein
LYNAGF